MTRKSEVMRLNWNVGRSIATMVLAMGAASCGQGSEQSGRVVQPVATKASLEARIADDAILPMDRANFSKTYSKLGSKQFQNANDLTRWAAVAAVAQGDACDRVAMANVSEKSTREKIVWFVDCENKQRMMIDQPQAEDARQRFGTIG